MNEIDALNDLTESVVDSYPEFVQGVRVYSRNHNCADKMIEYLETNRQATSSEILDYMLSL